MNWFKKYFIPHGKNSYKPHIFRKTSVVFLLVLVSLLFILGALAPKILSRIDLTALVLPKVLVDYANEDRATSNYRNLAINPVLEQAAQMKANDMAEKGYFAHNSPEGVTPWYWIEKAGYEFSYAGENLAVNFTDSKEVNKAWMASPGHRENIMNEKFTEIGIATAQGLYQGKMTTFIVQVFGTPAKKNSVAVSKPVTVKTQTPPKENSSDVKVLSESVSLEEAQEMFISVGRESEESNNPDVRYSDFAARALFSPKQTVSLVYLSILAIVMMALFFLVFYEMKKQNYRMIALALSLIFIIISLVYIFRNIVFDKVVVI